jgi:hypothetical protein
MWVALMTRRRRPRRWRRDEEEALGIRHWALGKDRYRDPASECSWVFLFLGGREPQLCTATLRVASRDTAHATNRKIRLRTLAVLLQAKPRTASILLCLQDLSRITTRSVAVPKTERHAESGRRWAEKQSKRAICNGPRACRIVREQRLCRHVGVVLGRLLRTLSNPGARLLAVSAMHGARLVVFCKQRAVLCGRETLFGERQS